MSVASIGPVAAMVYREDQLFSPWVYLALVFVEAGLLFVPSDCLPVPMHWLGPDIFGVSPLGLILASGVFLFALFWFKMTILVLPADLRVSFGWLPGYRRLVPLTMIARVEIVRFRPIRDHRGWGARHSPTGDRVYSARGDSGVRLHLTDGSRIIIGSQRSEDLARCLQSFSPSLP